MSSSACPAVRQLHGNRRHNPCTGGDDAGTVTGAHLCSARWGLHARIEAKLPYCGEAVVGATGFNATLAYRCLIVLLCCGPGCSPIIRYWWCCYIFGQLLYIRHPAFGSHAFPFVGRPFRHQDSARFGHILLYRQFCFNCCTAHRFQYSNAMVHAYQFMLHLLFLALAP